MPITIVICYTSRFSVIDTHDLFLNGGGNLINRNKVMKLGIKPERIRALCAIIEIQDKDFEEELEKLRLRYCPGNST